MATPPPFALEEEGEQYVDAHGDIDVLCESQWTNVRLKAHRKDVVIEGLNLNSLLLALFTLYGNGPEKENLPGGIWVWENHLNALLVNLNSLCTIEELVGRVFFLFSAMCEGNSRVASLTYGGISLIMYWIACFNVYISEFEFLQLKTETNCMRQIMEYDVSPETRKFDYFAKCKHRLIELEKMITKISNQRLLSSMGIARSTFVPAERENRATVVSLRQSVPVDQLASADSTSCAYVIHNIANIYVTKGEWTGLAVKKNAEQLKEFMAQAPAIKLEIFGGDTLFDSDEDSVDTKVTETSKAAAIDAENAVLPLPLPRLTPETFLLHDPKLFSTNILQIDLIELARQWTILDHATFCQISLCTLNLRVDVHYSQPRYLQMAAAESGAGRSNKSVRVFIDRFNAISAWVTHAVLSGNTSGERASILGSFISIAGYLNTLNNFNSVMAIVAALQQACIARLRISWELVSTESKDSLEELKTLMAGNMNYARYRDELGKRNLFVSAGFANAIAQSTKCGPVRTSSFSEYDLAWKKSIHIKHKWNDGNNSSRPNAVAERDNESDIPMSSSALLMAPDVTVLEGDDAEDQDHVGAVVPHLGAHLAELTSISEGNGDFLESDPHLFNVQKLQLYASTLEQLRNYQRLRYRLAPIRVIAAAINHTLKPHLALSAAAASEIAKNNFNLSLFKESDEEIEDYLAAIANGAKLIVPPRSGKNTVPPGGDNSSDDNSDSDSNSDNNNNNNKYNNEHSGNRKRVASNDSDSIATLINKQPEKYKPSNAYQRIMAGAAKQNSAKSASVQAMKRLQAEKTKQATLNQPQKRPSIAPPAAAAAAAADDDNENDDDSEQSDSNSEHSNESPQNRQRNSSSRSSRSSSSSSGGNSSDDEDSDSEAKSKGAMQSLKRIFSFK